jgi:hypothetical protein
MNERDKQSRRKILLYVAGGLGATILAGPEIFYSVVKGRLDRAMKNAENEYGLKSTAAAQSPEYQQKLIGSVLFNASASFTYADTGCSMTCVGADLDLDQTDFLTAGHCLPADPAEINIHQLQKPGQKTVSILRSDYEVFRSDVDDLVVIRVKNSLLPDLFNPVLVQVYKDSRDPYCYLSFPDLNGKNQTPIAFKTYVERDWLGNPIMSREGQPMLMSRNWGGGSGTGVGSCSEGTPVISAVVSRLNLFGNGETVIQPVTADFIEYAKQNGIDLTSK